MPTDSLRGLGILIVEDDALWRRHVTAQLERLGADVTGADSLGAARRVLEKLDFDFALLDVNLPDGLGTDLLKEKAFAPTVGVIVMTAHGGVAGAVEAMQAGAADYITKPFEAVELPLVIGRAQRARQTVRVAEHQRDDGPELFFGAALANLAGQLERILQTDARVQGALPPVLIQGETGTGKTAIARWLHHRGPRRDQPLVDINCSALPETLAESELFGHERGAFTDARTARMGLFEAAHGGTLFLDELASLSLPLQAKLLTAIEDQRIRRVGGNRFLPVDVRIIAASNQDLKQLVTTGAFREDLYHRLDLYRLLLPPLRERGADILRLAEQFLRRLCRRHRVPVRAISAAGQKRLLAHGWPGNVRELAHELERAIVFEPGPELAFESLQPAADSGAASAGAEDDWFNERFVLPQEGFSLDAAIGRLVGLAMRQAGQNVSAAARLLNVSRDVVRYRLHGRKPPALSGE